MRFSASSARYFRFREDRGIALPGLAQTLLKFADVNGTQSAIATAQPFAVVCGFGLAVGQVLTRQ
jgi:hypothetical protein